MELNDYPRQSFRYWMDCTFKSTKKWNRDILGLLNKPITPRKCVFPQANLHFKLSVDYVPDGEIWKDTIFVRLPDVI